MLHPWRFDSTVARTEFAPSFFIGPSGESHEISGEVRGRSRGFGFVEMDDAGAAQSAIEALNGADMQGRTLRVNEARPREERKPRREYRDY